ncbi:zinc-binding oxidoreductase ToxD [Chaetomium sp. MPI-SDFR-AT-0129]|nr:zinc-binding oxidoreductase ToxD [Chaetomium sp. MPI-SDFR-AT-0129]
MSIPATQKALLSTAIGFAAVQTVPVPPLKPGQLLVKTVAVALNPTDWKSLYAPDGSAVGTRLGIDFAGVVVDVKESEPGQDGEGKRKWEKGERVCGAVWGGKDDRGAFGEYVVTDGTLLFEVPAHLSFEQAATLPAGIMTCGQGLYRILGLPLPSVSAPSAPSVNPGNNSKPSGPYILIYGGSTASGLLGIQYAKLSGYTVLTTCSPHNFAYLRSLGADAVFDYHPPSTSETDTPDSDPIATLAAHINNLTSNTLTHAWDCRPTPDASSSRLCALALSSTLPGTYATLQPRIATNAVEHINPLVTARCSIAYTAFGEEFERYGQRYGVDEEEVEFLGGFFKLARELLESTEREGGRGLRPAKAEVREGGLDGVVGGLEDLRGGRVSGRKLVYRVGTE